MRALIVCNGFPPSSELLKKEASDADIIIGADGGGNTLLQMGIKPDIVTGDMDSFKKPEVVDFEIIHDPDQETNDLEKALSLALQNEAESCIVLGAFGKRMDHSLKNLSVLKQYHPAFRPLVFKDDRQEAFLIDPPYSSEELPVGTNISLFPLSGKVTGIVTEGLKYSLSNEDLINGQRDGTSNETAETSFAIDFESGDLVVFIGS